MIKIEDTSIVLAMAPPAGGRHAVTPRLLRHFNVLSIEAFNDETMKSIFQPFVDWHFNYGFDTSLKRYSRVRIALLICWWNRSGKQVMYVYILFYVNVGKNLDVLYLD